MSYPYEIITDSSCSLGEKYIDDNGIHILTLSYLIDGVEKPSYVQGQNFDYKAFYAAIRSKVKASTSQVNFDQAYSRLKPLLEAGKDVLYIGFSSGLSGTYQSVASAMNELAGEFPERKLLHVDSLSASVGYGYFLVAKAVDLRAEGKSIEEAHQFAADNRLKSQIWVTVDDLFHLQRGGRLSAPAAFFGSLLGVKPIITVNNEGKLVPYGKVRGRGKALNFFLEHMDEFGFNPKDQTVFIAHSDVLDFAQQLKSMISEKYGTKDFVINEIGPVIGAHTGPGTIALVYLADKPRPQGN